MYHLLQIPTRIDFTNTKALFSIAGLNPNDVDAMRVKLSTQMSDESYRRKLIVVLKSLGLPTNNQVHIGRKNGTMELEMNEVRPELIKKLGNWGADEQDKGYSSNMPPQPLRVKAGFDARQGLHYNPRTTCDPPNELVQMIFPFIEAAELDVSAYESNNGVTSDDPEYCAKEKVTAKAFLSLLKRLRIVVLQDAAVLVGKEGRNHAVLMLPVFQTSLFREFKESMTAHLEASASSNPSDARLEHVLPGVQARFQNLDSRVSSGFAAQALSQNMTNTKIGKLESKVDQVMHHQQQGRSWIQQVLEHASVSYPQQPPLRLQEVDNEAVNQRFSNSVESVSDSASDTNSTNLLSSIVYQNYQPPGRFQSVRSVVDHWEAMKLDEQEKTNGASWRKHITAKSSLLRRFLRAKYIVLAVHEIVAKQCCFKDQAIDALEALFTAKGKSLSKMEAALKAKNGF